MNLTSAVSSYCHPSFLSGCTNVGIVGALGPTDIVQRR